MYAPLSRCPERSTEQLDDVEDDATRRFQILEDALEPVDYRLLHLLFTGRPRHELQEDTGRSAEEIEARISRRRFLQVQSEVEKGVLDRIIRLGTWEPTTLAKAASSGAMKRIIDISCRERDPRTRLNANKAVLQYAGVEPPQRLEITTPDRVIEQMTAEELEALAERKVWPGRFKEVLRAFLPAPKPIDVTPEPPKPLVRDTGGDTDERDLPRSTFRQGG
jgi:hypothetical protein